MPRVPTPGNAVDHLDLLRLGFEFEQADGISAYGQELLLKLYLYDYLNRIRCFLSLPNQSYVLCAVSGPDAIRERGGAPEPARQSALPPPLRCGAGVQPPAAAGVAGGILEPIGYRRGVRKVPLPLSTRWHDQIWGAYFTLVKVLEAVDGEVQFARLLLQPAAGCVHSGGSEITAAAQGACFG